MLRVRPKAMTVAVILAGLLPILFGSGTGSEVMQRIAAPMVGGMITAPLLVDVRAAGGLAADAAAASALALAAAVGHEPGAAAVRDGRGRALRPATGRHGQAGAAGRTARPGLDCSP